VPAIFDVNHVRGIITNLSRATLVTLILVAGISLLPLPSSVVEAIYARGIYSIIAAVLVSVTGWVPFSLSFVALLALPFAVVIAIWRFRRARTKLSWRTLARGVFALVAVYGAFQLLWGFNYRREPVETLLELSPVPVTQADLERVASDLLEVIEDNTAAPRDANAAFKSIRASLQTTVSGITGRTPTLPPRVKSPFSGWLLGLRVSGVVSPFTLEAHVDAALPEPIFLAVSAHELTHLAGFAGEADTDLVSIVAGLRAADPYARYAVALNTYATVRAELPAPSRARFDARLPVQARADYRDYTLALDRHKLPDFVINASRIVYDGYLQSQGVDAGIRDYSRAVQLLAKWWRTVP
jgi:Protein of unknown function (DUF3810)